MIYFLFLLMTGQSQAAELGSKPHCRGDGDEIQLAFHLYGKNEKGRATDTWYSLACFGLNKKCVGASLNLDMPLAKENPATETGLWRLIKADGKVYVLKGSYRRLTINLKKKSIVFEKGQGKRMREVAKGYCP